MGITKKQKEVFDYIYEYQQTNGYSPTQKEIKEYFNFKSFGSVQRYLKYLTEAGYIATDWNARRGLTILKSNDPETPSSESLSEEIPLLGNVAAGNPIEAIENPDETVSVPKGMITKKGKYFALRVQGNSMINDGIFDNDIVVCRFQQVANQGQNIVAVVDGEATLKKYIKKSNKIELHPANDDLSPIMVTPEQHFKIAGVPVALFRSYE